MSSDTRRQPPVTETGRVITGIWREVLELPEAARWPAAGPGNRAQRAGR